MNYLLAHSADKREIHSHRKKKNREINSLGKMLVSLTNFLSKKFESKFLQFPHCVDGCKNRDLVEPQNFTLT